MDAISRIYIEVACATPELQLIVPLEVPAGTSASEAVKLSGILDKFPDLDGKKLTLGVFGCVVDPVTPVAAGDRVEIYRPLLADPKEVRRKRAAAGKTMSRSKD